ncbi:hypothetical protein [Bradyrhizobium sp. McL0616]|uniref:hypothetical protein n=1 Tax=Bradyrhizobium sp. McL0616 TaxID=3415674 RepID=UPI003CF5E4C4
MGVAPRGYEQARRRARSLGFDYIENEQLVGLSAEKRLERLEALVSKGVTGDAGARMAVLGTERRPPFLLSKLFVEYEAATKVETKDFSPSQVRVWRNGRSRAVAELVKLIGDKAITDLTLDDGLDYCEWWRGRLVAGEGNAKNANKAIGQLSRMLKEMNIRRRLNLPDVFKGLRLKGEVEKSRSPFEAEFIQERLLATGALDGMNEEARLILYVVARTGLRLSEAANLQPHTVHLDTAIPYVRTFFSLEEDGARSDSDNYKRTRALNVDISERRITPQRQR